MSREKPKPHVIYHLVKLAIFIAIAIIIFFFRVWMVEHLRHFIGSLMLLYASEEVLFDMLFERKNVWHAGKIYLALAETILGVSIYFIPVSIETTCVIWATWSILRECQEIKEIIVYLKHILPRILSGVESLAAIVLSVMLIIEPGEHHAMIHIYLLLVELVLNPLVPLLDELLSKKKEEKVEEKMS